MDYEIIPVDSEQVQCDGLPTPERSPGFAQAGGGGPLGHPRVYLHVESETGSVTCPYCSRVYRLNPGAQARAAH